MKNFRMRYAMPFVLVGISAVGCSAPAQPMTPTVERVSAGDLESLWETAGDTLRANYFRLDRQDRQEGILTTFPETTANWFEFWRPQPEPAFYWLEANTHTTQRQATVWIKPAGSGDYDVQVEVNRFRYSLPERQVTNSAEAMRIFSSGSPTYSGRMETPSQTASWIPLGRDGTMEQKVLQQIVQRHTLSATPTSQPDF